MLGFNTGRIWQQKHLSVVLGRVVRGEKEAIMDWQSTRTLRV
jgi:hypothetical protein